MELLYAVCCMGLIETAGFDNVGQSLCMIICERR